VSAAGAEEARAGVARACGLVADMAAFHRGSRVGDWAPLCELTSRLLAAALPLEAAPEAATAAEQSSTATAAAAAAGEQVTPPALPDAGQQVSEAAAGHQQAATVTTAGHSDGQPAALDANVAEVHRRVEAPAVGADTGAAAAANLAAAPAVGELAAQALRLLQAVLIGHCQVAILQNNPRKHNHK
jgi:hypothetical protein